MKFKKIIMMFISFSLFMVSCNKQVEISDNKTVLEEYEIIKSPIDFNSNGKDDYEDFLIGAKKDAKNHPRYDGAYVVGGYPEDDVGVCTDVIWRSFKEAGYSLKDMMDRDISLHLEDYKDIETPDPNIDFRRVKNQHSFFKKYAIELTTDLNKKLEWSAGDIVIFKNDYHIGIISNKRNKNGIPYVIHNYGQKEREDDFMGKIDILEKRKPIAHFRFDASRVPEDVLIKWK